MGYILFIASSFNTNSFKGGQLTFLVINTFFYLVRSQEEGSGNIDSADECSEATEYLDFLNDHVKYIEKNVRPMKILIF